MDDSPCLRLPEPGEWVPEDYFRHARVDEIFPRRPEAPLEVDLGCGDGGFLTAMAVLHPERNFLGVERLLGRVRKTCRGALRAGTTNVRVLRLESEYAVEWLLPPGSVSRLHLLFPDPWPKKRHRARRLFRSDFLPCVRRLLAPGGEFLFKTDHAAYFAWAEEVAGEAEGWERLPWPEDAFSYPLTDFEAHWLGEGRAIRRLRLRRTPDAA